MDNKVDFRDMFAAINARKEALVLPWNMLQGTLRKLSDAAFDDPERAEKLRMFAQMICENAGLEFLPGVVEEETDQNGSGEIPEHDDVPAPPLNRRPYLTPAISRVFRTLMEMLREGKEISSFSDLLQQVYGDKWETIFLSGQLAGSAAIAAQGTSQADQLQSVIAQSIRSLDAGIAVLNRYATDPELQQRAISKRLIKTYIMAAENPVLWEEAKLLLARWLNLSEDEDEELTL